MKNVFFLFLIFLLALLQSTFLSINLLLVFVVWQGRYYWAFLAGLSYDLISGNRLGLSSLLFLFIVLLFRLYLRKFEPRALFLASFVFLTSWLFAKIEKQIWHFGYSLVLSLAILFLRKRFKRETQLKLDL